eukprot:1561177-Prorocentrum_lima.AAC.1
MLFEGVRSLLPRLRPMLRGRASTIWPAPIADGSPDSMQRVVREVGDMPLMPLHSKASKD